MIQDNIKINIEEDFFTASSITETSPTLFKIKLYVQQTDRDKISKIRCIFQNNETFNESFKNSLFNETKNNKSYNDNNVKENTLLNFYKRNVKENFIVSRNENYLSNGEKITNIFHEIDNADISYSKGYILAFIPLDVTNKIRNKIKKGFVRIDFINEIGDILFKSDFVEIDFEEVYDNKISLVKINKKIIDNNLVFNSDTYIKKIPTNINDKLLNQAKNIINNINPSFKRLESTIVFADIQHSTVKQNDNDIRSTNIKIDSRFNSYNKVLQGNKSQVSLQLENAVEKSNINRVNSSQKSEILSAILSKRSDLVKNDLLKKGFDQTLLNKQTVDIDIAVKVGNEFNTKNKRKNLTVKKKIKLPINKQLVNNLVKEKKSEYVRKQIFNKLNMELSFDFLNKDTGVITLESLPLENYSDFIYINMFEGISINKKKNNFRFYSSPTFSIDSEIPNSDKKRLLSLFTKSSNYSNSQGRHQYNLYFDARKIQSISEVIIQIDIIEKELKITKSLKSSTALKLKSFKAFKGSYIDVVEKLNSLTTIDSKRTLIEFNKKLNKNILTIEKIKNSKPITELFDFTQSLGYENQNYIEKTDLIKSLLRQSIVLVEVSSIVSNKKFEFKDAFIAGNKISFNGDNLEIDLSYINDRFNMIDFIKSLDETERFKYDFLFLNDERIIDVYKPEDSVLVEKNTKVLIIPLPFLFSKYKGVGLDSNNNIINKYNDENELKEIEKTFYDFVFSFNPNFSFSTFLSIKKDYFGLTLNEENFYEKLKSLVVNSSVNIRFKELKEKLTQKDLFAEIVNFYKIEESRLRESIVNIKNENRSLEVISGIRDLKINNKDLFNTKLLEGRFISSFKDQSLYNLSEVNISYNRLSTIRLDILSEIYSEGFYFDKEDLDIFCCFVPVLTCEPELKIEDVNLNKYTQILSTDNFTKIIPSDDYFLTLDQQRNSEYFYGLDLVDFNLINNDQIQLKNEYNLQKNLLNDFRLFFDESKKIKFNLLANVLFIIKVDVELEKEEKVYSRTYFFELLDKSQKRIYNISSIKSILAKGFK